MAAKTKGAKTFKARVIANGLYRGGKEVEKGTIVNVTDIPPTMRLKLERVGNAPSDDSEPVVNPSSPPASSGAS